jgi:hypothetical protein
MAAAFREISVFEEDTLCKAEAILPCTPAGDFLTTSDALGSLIDFELATLK